ncbi:MAG: DNA polymerase I [Thermomicrobiales bacterium]|nr:DNA polymerase I [Thermomicrobiales bacterium]
MADSGEGEGARPERPVLMLVDGYGLIFRAYHAMPPSIASSTGEQTNAVFGFAAMLLDVIRREQPDYAVVALEGGRTFREEEYADYKAHRGPMPDDLRPQVARIEEFVDALAIPIERRDGFEADDVIGSLAARCSHEGDLRVVIVTGDSDLLQLVDDNVTVTLPGAQRFNDLRIYDLAAVLARFGFGPDLVPDYKALVGDTSDNIPGVPGIGEKTAKALIGRFGGVEEILAHADDITPTRARNAIANNADLARLSLRLATIRRDLDIPLDLDRSRVGDYDREAIVDLFRELEFGRGMLNRLPEPKSERAEAKPVADRPPSQRTIVGTPEQLAQLVERLNETGAAAIDVETDSLDSLEANLVGIALAVSPHESFYVPLRHRPGARPQLSEEAVRGALAPLLADPALRLYAHHAKYDMAVLERHGFPFANLAFETMIAAYLLGENKVGLKELAFRHLGVEMTEITALIGTGRNQLTMDLVDSAEAGDYACGDVEATYALVEVFRPRIADEGLIPVLEEIEQPLVPVLVRMEAAGIAIDVPFLKKLSAEVTERMTELETEMAELAGREVNVNSPKQLAALLFEELALPAGRRTKTGYSVDADVLESLREQHPIVDLILEYRTLGKLKSTYIDVLPTQVNPHDGRVHTSYNQTIAATGRLSSTDPNLQNIPVRTELGRRVREAFIADRRPGRALAPNAVLLAADYSQIELRLLADMSGDPFLLDAFNAGADIHRATAAIVAGVAPEDVTPDMRRIAKTVNFGVLYGMQAFGLSRDTGLSREESTKFIEDYWKRLPRVREFFDETVAFGVKHGYVMSPSGRRRAYPNLVSPNGQLRMAAERQAKNMPLQGGAADIMKIAMIRLDAALRERTDLQARMLLQVHDELVLEVAEEDLAETAALVRATMEGAAQLKVPLIVEVSAGPNWEDQTDV